MTIEIYTTLTCSYCTQAKQLLSKQGLAFTEINVGGDSIKSLEMMRRSGRRTVPQIFMDGRAIGGYDQLKTLFNNARAV